MGVVSCVRAGHHLALRPRATSFWKRNKRPAQDAEFDVLFRQFFLRSRLQTDALSKYLKCGWRDLVVGEGWEVSEKEAKYREVVWDLFQEEVKYLTRQLQPLELVRPPPPPPPSPPPLLD